MKINEVRNQVHPTIKRNETNVDKLNLHYCPRCELHYFMTNEEMVKHLGEHERLGDIFDEVNT
jgi:hypothetical protein